MSDRTFARVAYKQSFLSLTIWDCKDSLLFLLSKLSSKYFQENEADTKINASLHPMHGTDTQSSGTAFCAPALTKGGFAVHCSVS